MARRPKNWLEKVEYAKGVSSADSRQIWYHFYRNYFIGLAQSYFVWKNVPDTIPKNWIEKTLVNHGNLAMFNTEDYGLVVTRGTKSHKLNIYGDPIMFTPTTPNGVIRKPREVIYTLADCDSVDNGCVVFNSNNINMIDAQVISIKLFPTLDDDIDTICREAYRGGYVMVNPRFKEKVINEPLWVFDVNSEHPANMNYQLMPYGKPKVVSGYVKPKADSELAIYHGVVKFEVKKGALPCLQFRDSLALVGLGIRKTDYPMSTKGEYYPITLTNIDLEMLERVAYYDFKAETTLLFKAKKGMFSDYLSSLFYAKEHAETLGERTDAKLKMNALYGKFGTKAEQAHKIVNIDENGVLDLSQKETEYVKPIYVPVAVFTTVYGRRQVLMGAMDNIDKFLYTDTDSLHFLKGDGTMPDLDIDPKKIGAWKLEDEFNQAKYLRPKLYMEQLVENGKIVKKEVKGAGMTKEVKQQITLDNFVIGSKFDGKKQFKQTVGGAVIVETQFTIKENLF